VADGRARAGQGLKWTTRRKKEPLCGCLTCGVVWCGDEQESNDDEDTVYVLLSTALALHLTSSWSWQQRASTGGRKRVPCTALKRASNAFKHQGSKIIDHPKFVCSSSSTLLLSLVCNQCIRRINRYLVIFSSGFPRIVTVA